MKAKEMWGAYRLWESIALHVLEHKVELIVLPNDLNEVKCEKGTTFKRDMPKEGRSGVRRRVAGAAKK